MNQNARGLKREIFLVTLTTREMKLVPADDCTLLVKGGGANLLAWACTWLMELIPKIQERVLHQGIGYYYGT